MIEFVAKEPGSYHIPSDRYAVSVVLPVLLLAAEGKNHVASDFLARCAAWLCDRYEHGSGLASVIANPQEEVDTLFGAPFDFIEIPDNFGSLLETVILDLCMFLGNYQLYEDILNDCRVVGALPTYWQVSDTGGMLRIDGEDVRMWPNIEFFVGDFCFEDYDYAEHIRDELRSYRILDYAEPIDLMSVMLLLRDRYFPTLWKSLK